VAFNGNGRFDVVKNARIRKTKMFFENKDLFMEQLVFDIFKGINQAKKEGFEPSFRLNAYSDIKWENVSFTINGKYYDNIMSAFPDVAFYDYTKIANRDNLPSNYDLTFSYSGVLQYQKYVNIARANNMRIAVVFRSVSIIPNTFMGLPVIGGDNSDIRHVEPKNTIVALYAKGAAKRDTTGFVVDSSYRTIALHNA